MNESSKRRACLEYILFAIFILVIGAIYVKYTQPITGGWDPVAYLYAGEQLAQGDAPAYCHTLNSSIGPYFTLAGFNIRRNHNNTCLYLNYPPGFPLLLATAHKIGSALSIPRMMLYAPAFCGVLGVLATFTLTTLLFNRRVGALAALSLGLAPTYVTFSTAPWSDVPGTALLTTGLAGLIWGNNQKQVWKQIAGGSIGAIFIGWSIFTRYVNGLVLLSLAAYLLAAYRRKALQLKGVQLFSVCVMTALLGLLLFNRVYYGGFFSTPYSSRHGWYEWPAFSLRYVFGRSPVGNDSLLAVVETVWQNYRWLLMVAVVGWAFMPLPERVLVLGSTLIFAGLYSTYAFPARGINTRFLVIFFPFVSIAIGYALWNFMEKRRKWGMALLVLFVLTVIASSGHCLQTLMQRNRDIRGYVAHIVGIIENCCEKDAVFLAYNTNDIIAYYGQRTTLFYRRISPVEFEQDLVSIVGKLLDDGRPVYYVQDASPPFMNSLSVLNSRFHLISLHTTPPIYKVERKATTE
ncbi:MAG: STT3 domain-containing protein [Anaerolineae bacterium]